MEITVQGVGQERKPATEESGDEEEEAKNRDVAETLNFVHHFTRKEGMSGNFHFFKTIKGFVFK